MVLIGISDENIILGWGEEEVTNIYNTAWISLLQTVADEYCDCHALLILQYLVTPDLHTRLLILQYLDDTDTGIVMLRS